MSKSSLEDLITVVQRISARGWCPGTGGNFSVRLSDRSFLVTASGVHKGSVTKDDFVECSIESGEALEDGKKPSAETLLHAMLYRLSDKTTSVLHTHSVPITTLTKSLSDSDELSFSGYEMQKTLAGIDTHESEVILPVIDNSQDMVTLQNEVQSRIVSLPLCYGFALRGHGLYAWGASIAEAERHLEGYEFLVECRCHEK